MGFFQLARLSVLFIGKFFINFVSRFPCLDEAGLLLGFPWKFLRQVFLVNLLTSRAFSDTKILRIISSQYQIAPKKILLLALSWESFTVRLNQPHPSLLSGLLLSGLWVLTWFQLQLIPWIQTQIGVYILISFTARLPGIFLCASWPTHTGFTLIVQISGL